MPGSPVPGPPVLDSEDPKWKPVSGSFTRIEAASNSTTLPLEPGVCA